MLSLNKSIERFMKFGIVGVLNTLINWIIFVVLNFLGVYYILANVIAYCIATANSYIFNSKWVFKYNGKNKKETTIKFVVLNLFGLGLNTIILYFLVDILAFNKLFSLIIATGVVMVVNYTVNKLWVFNMKNIK